MSDEPRGYDNGGWLAPSYSQVYNGHSEPEPVLSPRADHVATQGRGEMTGSLLWTVLIVLVIIALLLFILRGRL